MSINKTNFIKQLYIKVCPSCYSSCDYKIITGGPYFINTSKKNIASHISFEFKSPVKDNVFIYDRRNPDFIISNSAIRKRKNISIDVKYINLPMNKNSTTLKTIEFICEKCCYNKCYTIIQ
jgi:hypothetical protein